MKERLALLREPGFGGDKMKGLIYGGSVVVVVFEKSSQSYCQEPGFHDRFAQNPSRIFKMSMKHNCKTTERCDARKTTSCDL